MPDHETVSVQAEANLRILKNRAVALDKAINLRRKQNAIDRYELGTVLTKIKEAIGHTKWLPWLEEHSIEKRYAQRCMELAKCVNLTHLESEWKRICGAKESEPETTSVKPLPVVMPPKPPAPTAPASGQSGNENGQSKTVDSPEGLPDAGLEIEGTDALDRPQSSDEPPSAPEPVSNIPERLRLIFASKEQMESAARRATLLANVFQEIEKCPAYRNQVEGKKHREHSTFIRAAGYDIELKTPVQPCVSCGGAYEPSPDSDICEACGNKGFQTKEDLGT